MVIPNSSYIRRSVSVANCIFYCFFMLLLSSNSSKFVFMQNFCLCSIGLFCGHPLLIWRYSVVATSSFGHRPAFLVMTPILTQPTLRHDTKLYHDTNIWTWPNWLLTLCKLLVAKRAWKSSCHGIYRGIMLPEKVDST